MRAYRREGLGYVRYKYGAYTLGGPSSLSRMDERGQEVGCRPVRDGAGLEGPEKALGQGCTGGPAGHQPFQALYRYRDERDGPLAFRRLPGFRGLSWLRDLDDFYPSLGFGDVRELNAPSV